MSVPGTSGSDAAGWVQSWGLAPALDLGAAWTRSRRSAKPPSDAEAAAAAAAEESEDALNILLVEPADVGHLLKTIAGRALRIAKATRGLEVARAVVARARETAPSAPRRGDLDEAERAAERALAVAKRPLHFYVAEGSADVLARHVLLLQLAFAWDVPLRLRAHTWLEVYGNTLVQERTATMISDLAPSLVSLVCDGAGTDPVLERLLDFSLLKGRSRDDICAAFEGYRLHKPAPDLAAERDTRLRRVLGPRYDHQRGVVAWDYAERIKPHAPIIHAQLYRPFRKTGIAYEFGDQSYAVTNRTLLSFSEVRMGARKGPSALRRGFWADMVSTPYVALGIALGELNTLGDINDGGANAGGHRTDTLQAVPGTCTSKGRGHGKAIGDAPVRLADDSLGETDLKLRADAKALFQVNNKGTGVEQRQHHSVEVAVYNLLGFLWAIEHGKRYRMEEEERKKSGGCYSGLGAEKDATGDEADAGDAASDAASAAEGAAAAAASERALRIVAALDGVKISFLAGLDCKRKSGQRSSVSADRGAMVNMARRKKYRGLFDVALLAHMKVHYLLAVMPRAEALGVSGVSAAAAVEAAAEEAAAGEPPTRFAFAEVLRDVERGGALVVVETPKHAVTMAPDDRRDYMLRADVMAATVGLRRWTAATGVVMPQPNLELAPGESPPVATDLQTEAIWSRKREANSAHVWYRSTGGKA